MDLSNLTPAKKSVRNKRRIGRGIGSGKGRTSTRGHKGQKSRSGYSRRLGFEGGQMPLHRRLPKFGFNNRNRVFYKPVNLSLLQQLADEKNLRTVDPDVLRDYGVLQNLYKVLGSGELTAKLEVKAHAFSKSAQEAIEKAGGTAEKL